MCHNNWSRLFHLVREAGDVDKRLAQQFRERWQVVNAIEAQEQEMVSIALRWKQLNAIWRLAIGLRLPQKELDDQAETVRQRWAKLRERLL